MLLMVKDENSRSRIILKVQRVMKTCRPDDAGVKPNKRYYKCLLARHGRVLHASVTTPDRENITVADLLFALSMSVKGRNFLKGFKNSDIRLNAIPIDDQTCLKKPMDICPG